MYRQFEAGLRFEVEGVMLTGIFKVFMSVTNQKINEFHLAQALFQVNKLVGSMSPREVRQEVNQCISEIVVRWILQHSHTDEEGERLYEDIKKDGPIRMAESKGLELWEQRASNG
tara:strand:+ start:751 stop:1095 length:345 start_codon:yes stop_codon:yes gene_type:complete